MPLYYCNLCMASIRGNNQHLSRDYQFSGPHLVSYKVVFTVPFHSIAHLHHYRITLHEFFVIMGG